MAKLPDDWNALIDIVEGNEALTSCTVVNGRPRPSMQPIPPKAKPNLAALIEVLRSDVELPRIIRDRLADWLAEEGSSRRQLIMRKRKRGQPRAAIDRHWEIAMRFEEIFPCADEKLTRQRAIGQCEEEFDVTRATVEKAIRDYRAAREEHERVLRNG